MKNVATAARAVEVSARGEAPMSSRRRVRPTTPPPPGGTRATIPPSTTPSATAPKSRRETLSLAVPDEASKVGPEASPSSASATPFVWRPLADRMAALVRDIKATSAHDGDKRGRELAFGLDAVVHILRALDATGGRAFADVYLKQEGFVEVTDIRASSSTATPFVGSLNVSFNFGDGHALTHKADSNPIARKAIDEHTAKVASENAAAAAAKRAIAEADAAASRARAEGARYSLATPKVGDYAIVGPWDATLGDLLLAHIGDGGRDPDDVEATILGGAVDTARRDFTAIVWALQCEDPANVDELGMLARDAERRLSLARELGRRLADARAEEVRSAS